MMAMPLLTIRHPELASGSISLLAQVVSGAQWMLKQVQHDDSDQLLRAFAPSREKSSSFDLAQSREGTKAVWLEGPL